MMDVINVWLAVRSKMTNERCHAVACKYYIKKKVCLICAIVAYRGSRGIAALILNLEARSG
jgi:hypothetical protein